MGDFFILNLIDYHRRDKCCKNIRHQIIINNLLILIEFQRLFWIDWIFNIFKTSFKLPVQLILTKKFIEKSSLIIGQCRWNTDSWQYLSIKYISLYVIGNIFQHTLILILGNSCPIFFNITNNSPTKFLFLNIDIHN